jgi:hemoglobin
MSGAIRMEETKSLYEKIGGADRVRDLVEAFYPRVQAHPLLKPIFPEDIRPVMEKQYLFLTQFLGGPPLYTEKYGHPMLRARHLPFPITPARAEAWLDCMSRAMDEVGITGQEHELFFGRLVIAAHHMVNQADKTEG